MAPFLSWSHICAFSLKALSLEQTRIFIPTFSPQLDSNFVLSFCQTVYFVLLSVSVNLTKTVGSIYATCWVSFAVL